MNTSATARFKDGPIDFGSLPAKHNLAIFDLDGTVTESAALHRAALIAALEDQGLAKPDLDWSGYQDHADSWIFYEIFEAAKGFPPSDSVTQDFETKFTEIFKKALELHEIKEISSASNFIRYLLLETAWAVAFATGSFRGVAEQKLAALGLGGQALPLVTASEHVSRHAQARAAKEEASATFSCPYFKQVVCFGDGASDLHTAKALTLGFIGISKGETARRLSEEGAQVFADFTDSDRVFTALESCQPLPAWPKTAE